MSSPAGQRIALFIANDTYHFDGLSRLYAPVSDAEQLRELLRDPEIGGFRPTDLLVNESKAEIERSIERLFRGACPDDVVLLYFSGHGLRTRQNLYLATSNTDPQLLSSTGISATFIRELIKDSAAAAKVILLDCCYSGAFLGADVMKSTPTIDDVGQELAAGDGICVLTATSAVETAEDGRGAADQSAPLSIFTAAMVKGIGTGLADNGSGRISAHDLWTYTLAEVRSRTSRQTPNHYGLLKDEVYIAKVRRRHPGNAEVGDRVQLGGLLGRLEQDSALGLRAEAWWGTGRLKVPIGQERRTDGAAGETVWLDLAGPDGNLLVIGRAGAGKSTLLRTLAGSLALTHAPDEAQIYVLESSNRLGSMGALPHIAGVAGDDEPEQVLSLLQTIVAEIRARKKMYRANNIDSPASLRAARSVLVGGPAADIFLLLDRWGDFCEQIPDFAAILRHVASAGPEYGVHVVATARDWTEAPDWLADLLPAHIELRLHRPHESRIHSERAGRLPDGPGWALYRGRPFRVAMPDLRELPPDKMVLPDLADGAAELVSRVAGAWPTRPADGEVRRPSFGGNVDFADLFGIGADDRLDLEVAWQHRSKHERLRIPIGVTHQGETVELDLKQVGESGMGQYGLLVGATGSGKSMLLKDIVLGLAVTHPPEAVNFLLVDFRGSETFDGLQPLPHVSAVVNALAAELPLVDRLMATLAGEIERRRQALRRHNCADLAAYESARRRGRDLEALPALVLVIDEFTELLAQKPDFGDTLVAIARRGRALGLHLLLASARLEGYRLGPFEAYLSFRIGLRMFSAAESRMVLGVPDAYELPSTPGFAYLKADAAAPIRFKTAYLARPERRHDQDSETRGVQRTLLDSLVSQVRAAGEQARRIWLPPLSEPVTVAELLSDRRWAPGGFGKLELPVGIVDDPFEQAQRALVLSLGGDDGNVAVVGGTRAGKSTALATIVLSAAASHTPEQVQFYLLDIGGSLADLDTVPHVGAVVGRNEPDRMRRTVAEVATVLSTRRRRFQEWGVGSMAEFRRRRDIASDPVRSDEFGDVFLVVDDWGYARRHDETLEQQLIDLTADGLGYGVHVIVSAVRWAHLRPVFRERFGTKLELRLDDPGESEFTRNDAARVPGTPGRGVIRAGTAVKAMMMALPRLEPEPDPGAAPHAALASARMLAQRYPDRRAPEVRALPTRVARENVLAIAAAEGIEQTAGHLVVGLRATDLAPLVLDFTKQPHLLVFGDADSGKTTLLANIVDGIGRSATTDDAAIVIIDPARKLLDVSAGLPHVVRYSPSAQGISGSVDTITQYIEKRAAGPDVSPQQLRDRSWWHGPELFVIIDDYERVCAASTGNPLAPLAEHLAHGHDIGLHVIIARSSSGAGLALHDPVLGRMRDLGVDGVVLSGSPEEGALLGAVRPATQPPGRGTYVTRSRPPELVQISYLPQL
ncbi:type VII secretion protein EccCb [Nocardia cyriacigeorgica]|uniref:Type VII secretion protein EccCb n=1 Tax=Nocardia cyriacigeorgica TaxID=135487 RepID=A0ABX0CWB0_9NOCA|nr:type VII secretion protein EccCb [Nocardia cyriacigeorgica]NEW57854.1 type VII secretion protein EccCb [Nocardia cyriacigeorgica]